jgi:hypothetical protein
MMLACVLSLHGFCVLVLVLLTTRPMGIISSLLSME